MLSSPRCFRNRTKSWPNCRHFLCRQVSPVSRALCTWIITFISPFNQSVTSRMYSPALCKCSTHTLVSWCLKRYCRGTKLLKSLDLDVQAIQFILWRHLQHDWPLYRRLHSSSNSLRRAWPSFFMLWSLHQHSVFMKLLMNAVAKSFFLVFIICFIAQWMRQFNF